MEVDEKETTTAERFAHYPFAARPQAAAAPPPPPTSPMLDRTRREMAAGARQSAYWATQPKPAGGR